MSGYVDVHTHLTHPDFDLDREEVIARAITTGLKAIVVNGLEPVSNRAVLEMAAKHMVVKPALRIYPVDAVNDLLPADFGYRVGKFSVQEELAFIRQAAQDGKLIAIGECGLDGYALDESTFAMQEKVFEELIQIASSFTLPLIVHTRKLEKRTLEICRHFDVKKVNFHCFSGKPKEAQAAAEKHNWYFSIPANARRSEGFVKMLKLLPIENILTETDAPYLAPERNTRNEPANVAQTVELLAELRGLSHEAAKDQVWANFQRLFAFR